MTLTGKGVLVGMAVAFTIGVLTAGFGWYGDAQGVLKDWRYEQQTRIGDTLRLECDSEGGCNR